MYLYFILSALSLIAVIGLAAARFTGERSVNSNKILSRWLWGVLAFFALVFLISLVKIVPTKQVGIVTTFGKPVGTVGNGLHIKAPWQQIKTLDGAIQNDVRKRQLRIGTRSKGTPEVSIRWRIREGAADALYRDYREFDAIRSSLVYRSLDKALSRTLATYDPLAGVDAKTGKVTGNGSDDLSPGIFTALTKEGGDSYIGNQIEVLSISIPGINFDGETEKRIEEYQAELGRTRVAEQKVQTSIKTAEANNRLRDSVSNDPNVLVSRCFDILQDMVNKNRQVPTGFSCWSGGSPAVIVPSARK